jgi:tRNA-2-methylthio-N6-dimethylallyladenosine synthase
MKYHIVTLGCQMNMSDSERVRTVLEGMGYIWTDQEEEANLVGILACSVRQKAIDKVYSRIRKWNKWKNNRDLLTFITGCILDADRDKFLKLFDIVFPMNELPQLADTILQYGVSTAASLQGFNSRRQMDEFWQVPPTYTSHFEAFVPIQNGCDKFCTFCAVPYTRGREVSRPSVEILDQVRSLVESGYKSITLLGQNVNSYGLDKEGVEIGFSELLRQIGEYGKESGTEFWVYFTSPHPRDMKEDVIRTIADFPVLAKQIHLPLQSGDEKVLIRMNRNHSMAQYRRIVDDVRSIIPEATLFTDIIVGFSGETEEQFENTRKAMEEFRFNMAYIATYSPRPGARSARWDDDVPHALKKDRLHRLSDELRSHAFVQNMKLVGKTMRVLVRDHDRKNGYLSGHTEGRIIVRFPSGDDGLIGSFVDVRIASVTEFSAEGELIPSGVEAEA